MGSGGCFTQVEHPPFYVAARGLARLPLNGVPAARLRAGHARPLRQKPPFDKGGQTVEKGVLTPWPPLRGGSARRRWGRELYGCPKYFGLWQGSLPPPLRGTAPPLTQAPPPPYRGSLSRRGRFFRHAGGEHCSPVHVCLVSKPPGKMRCCGKLAGDQWSPLHIQ